MYPRKVMCRNVPLRGINGWGASTPEGIYKTLNALMQMLLALQQWQNFKNGCQLECLLDAKNNGEQNHIDNYKIDVASKNSNLEDTSMKNFMWNPTELGQQTPKCTIQIFQYSSKLGCIILQRKNMEKESLFQQVNQGRIAQ